MTYVNVHYFTNLDEAQRYLPHEHAASIIPVPATGTRVRMRVTERFAFDLEVVAVTYDFSGSRTRVRAELHVPRCLGWSIKEWADWFARNRDGVGHDSKLLGLDGG